MRSEKLTHFIMPSDTAAGKSTFACGVLPHFNTLKQSAVTRGKPVLYFLIFHCNPFFTRKNLHISPKSLRSTSWKPSRSQLKLNVWMCAYRCQFSREEFLFMTAPFIAYSSRPLPHSSWRMQHCTGVIFWNLLSSHIKPQFKSRKNSRYDVTLP